MDFQIKPYLRAFALLGVLFLYPLNATEPLRLANAGKTDYTIVLPDNATPVQKTASEELASYLNRMTGAIFPIVVESEAGLSGKQFLIGPSPKTAELLAKAHLPSDQKLEYDQVIVQSVGETVILTGHPQRGMLYAVYTFLENDFGCQWWTEEEERVPSHRCATIQVTPVNYVPKLKFRDPYWRTIRGGNHLHFAVKMRSNGDGSPATEPFGSHQGIFLGHSFYYLIPPEKYFLDHPEWFSEVDGTRKIGFAWEPDSYYKFHQSLPKENQLELGKGATQLCLSNEELLYEVTKNVLEELRAHPNEKMISISQNDNNKGGYCHCAKCAAIDEEEGSPAGTLLRFVNRVAEEVEKEFPDLLVNTYAYDYTRKPPKLTHARHNVIVLLCASDCSYIEPFGQGEQNRSFTEDIRGWVDRADQLMIWDYETDFCSYLLPFPNHRVLKENINFFVNHKVVSVMEQGDNHLVAGNFVQLRAWVTAKLLWNPDLDTETLIKEFIAGYYAPELVPVYLDYINLLADACEKSGIRLTMTLANTDTWLDLETLNQATALHRQAAEIAERLAQENPEKYQKLPYKVMCEQFTIDLIWALNGKDFRAQAIQEGKEYLGPADPLQAAQDFFDRFEKVNGIMYRETAYPRGFEQYKEEIYSKYR